jgi:hypothetical protein
MLKRLISLLLAVVVIYAAWHTGMALLHYYQFKDAIGELALFAGTSTEDQLKERVMQLADQYEIPLDSEAVTVRTDPDVTDIATAYVASVKLLPNYTYEWKLEPTARVVHVR